MTFGYEIMCCESLVFCLETRSPFFNEHCDHRGRAGALRNDVALQFNVSQCLKFCLKFLTRLNNTGKLKKSALHDSHQLERIEWVY